MILITPQIVTTPHNPLSSSHPLESPLDHPFDILYPTFASHIYPPLAFDHEYISYTLVFYTPLSPPHTHSDPPDDNISVNHIQITLIQAIKYRPLYHRMMMMKTMRRTMRRTMRMTMKTMRRTMRMRMPAKMHHNTPLGYILLDK